MSASISATTTARLQPAVAAGDSSGNGRHNARHADPLHVPAIAMTGVHKSFSAGVAGCSITIRVLVRAELRIWPGEVVGIAGEAGAGKSTLLLCAAGLLRPDMGSIAWFGARVGDDERAGGAAWYLPVHAAVRQPDVERALSAGARLLLLDHASPARLDDLRGAIGRKLALRGAALVVASRDRASLARIASRILVLGGGRLHAAEHVSFAPAESQRKRSAARASSEFPSALALARMRSTCGRSFRSPQ